MRRTYVGSVILQNTVIITDPCYNIDTLSPITIIVKPGRYKCYLWYSKNGVARLELIHDSCKLPPIYNLISTEVIVYSGTCGIFDYQYFKENHLTEELTNIWYDLNVKPYIDDSFNICNYKGIWNTSDNGTYSLYAGYYNNECVSLQITFIEYED